MKVKPIDKPLALSLDPDESLVLFDFLWRREQSGEPMIDDLAAAKVLTSILARLEKHLVAPFDPKYAELLSTAQSRVLNSDDTVSGPAADRP